MQFVYPDENAQFIYPALPSSGGGGSAVEIEPRTLTSGEAAAKSLTLSFTPLDPTKVVVHAVGGSTQFYGTDYTVSGTTLSWSGLGLDTIGLVDGDQLVILYNK